MEGGAVFGGGKYETNSRVTISAIPSSGYKFVRWTGGVSSTSASYILTVTNNVTATAVFEKSEESTTQEAICDIYNGYTSGLTDLFKSRGSLTREQEQFIISLANIAAFHELGASMQTLQTDLINYPSFNILYSKLNKLNNHERYTQGWTPNLNLSSWEYDALVSPEVGNTGFQLKFYFTKEGETNALGLVIDGLAIHTIEAALEFLERKMIDNTSVSDDFLYDMHRFNALNFMSKYCR